MESNIYFNGLYQESGYDFTTNGTFITASGFNSVDGSLYDLISGERTRYEYHYSGSGTYMIGGVAATQDVYLNGQKLVSGMNYSGVGTNLFLLNVEDLATGILQFVPRHEDIYTIKTGNVDLGSFKYVVEQAWLNGQRLKNEESYIRTNSCTIRGENSLREYGRQIYSNTDNFWDL